MDPDELLNHGAQCSCDEDLAVRAQHFFVCIASDAKQGFWAPLFTGTALGTREIPQAAKSGNPRWTGSPAHYHPGQLWRASHKAVQRAAEAARDPSTPRLPNRIAAPHVPRRDEFPAMDDSPAR